VPIFNGQRQIIGTLVGVIDLNRANFLDNITNSTYGQTGGYLLIDSKSRLIITATDARRRLELLVPGFNPLVDRFILGFEGSGVAVNPMGVDVLASVHTIPIANWHIVVSLHSSEAFTPIQNMQCVCADYPGHDPAGWRIDRVDAAPRVLAPAQHHSRTGP
jgi:hypothetical protein